MLHKSYEIIETKTDETAGTFEALVSVFGNVDRGGDRVMPGAFTKTLERWRATGDPIPVILSHQWDNPMSHIGVADPYDVVETEKGLRVKARLDISDNDVARQVYKLLKRRSLKEFSFGYDVPKGGQKRSKDGANELSDINLFEVGPTLKGMNEGTELYAVKSALGVPRELDELRRATVELERDEVEAHLPDVPEPPPAPDPQPDPEPSPQPEPAPDAAEQREKARRVAAELQREREERILPDDVEPRRAEPEPEPAPAPVAPDAAEQRIKADRVASRERREREQQRIPADVEPAQPDPGPDLAAELEQVKATLAELSETLHALVKTDETAPDPQDLRRRAEAERREHEREGLPDLPEQVEPDEAAPDGGPKKTPEALDAIVHPDDVQGAKSGHLKAVWSVQYVNDLPDSAFLHAADGDRHFAYKDQDGNIDLPHLRNALARIPQSPLPQDVRDSAAARAQRILDAQQKADVTGKDRFGGRSVDPLREQADSFALEFASGGLSLRKPPRKVAPARAPELMPLGELKQRMRDEMLRHLSEDQATP